MKALNPSLPGALCSLVTLLAGVAATIIMIAALGPWLADADDMGKTALVLYGNATLLSIWEGGLIKRLPGGKEMTRFTNDHYHKWSVAFLNASVSVST